MMGIYIKGMEMPKEDRLTLQISADGAVYVVNSCSITAETYTTDAVPVPAHGRLIDADAFSEEMKKRHKAASDWYDSVEDNEMLARAESTMMAFTECLLTLDAMQTVIEAEGGDSDV